MKEGGNGRPEAKRTKAWMNGTEASFFCNTRYSKDRIYIYIDIIYILLNLAREFLAIAPVEPSPAVTPSKSKHTV